MRRLVDFAESNLGLGFRFCMSFICVGFLIGMVISSVNAQSRYKDVDMYDAINQNEHRISMLEADDIAAKADMNELKYMVRAISLAMAGLLGEVGIRVAKRKA